MENPQGWMALRVLFTSESLDYLPIIAPRL